MRMDSHSFLKHQSGQILCDLHADINSLNNNYKFVARNYDIIITYKLVQISLF